MKQRAAGRGRNFELRISKICPCDLNDLNGLNDFNGSNDLNYLNG